MCYWHVLSNYKAVPEVVLWVDGKSTDISKVSFSVSARLVFLDISRKAGGFC